MIDREPLPLEAGIDPLHWFYSQIEDRATEIRTVALTIAPAFLQSPEAMQAYFNDHNFRTLGRGDPTGVNLRLRKERNHSVEARIKNGTLQRYDILGQCVVDKLVHHDRPALNFILARHAGKLATVKVLGTDANTNAYIGPDFVVMRYIDDAGNPGAIGFENDGSLYTYDPEKLDKLNRRFEELDGLATPLPNYLRHRYDSYAQ